MEIIPTVAHCSISLTHNDCQYKVRFHIIDLKCQDIIGRATDDELKLIKKINTVTFNLDDVLKIYNDLFQGIGCIRNFECNLTL